MTKNIIDFNDYKDKNSKEDDIDTQIDNLLNKTKFAKKPNSEIVNNGNININVNKTLPFIVVAFFVLMAFFYTK